MDAQRWQRVEQIFHQALDCPVGDRSAFLARACGDDRELHSEIAGLLQQSDEGVLDRPVWQAAGRSRYDDSTTNMIGRKFAHFEIVERLGEGGMGAVYKARDRHLDRDVALKVLLPEALVSLDRRRRFVLEAKSASALNHPNIIHIYDIDEADGELYIAMEYVAGQTLDRKIARKGLPLRQALDYAVPIAAALSKAHAAGIVHRDLKPSNVMVTSDQTVKVLDFGLAKLMDDGSDPGATLATGTQEGTVLGTAAYMSPEQAEGRAVDARSDIFSFGAVLYEMLTGQRAFAGESRMATISAVLRDDPKPPSEIRQGLPRELERIVSRCLRKDPSRRFQHMEDLRVALEEMREESEAGERLPFAQIPANAPVLSSRRRWVLGAIGAGLLVISAWRLIAPPSRQTPGAPDTIQVTTSPGVAIGASFSPDGKRIAYSSNRSGWFEIYIKPVGARGEEKPVTSDGQQNTDPAWSPDGKSIAYHSVAQRGIWVIPVEGGTPRRVSSFGSGPSWSPDNKKLAFRSFEPGSLTLADLPGDGDATIWTVGIDGSGLQQITTPFNPPGQHGDPTWSPDGQRIVFASMGIITMGFRGELWSVDAAGGNLQKLSKVGQVDAVNPVFAPDGQGVYFAGRPKYDAPNGVYYLPITGSQAPVELYRIKQAYPARLAVSHDGKSLAFTRQVNVSQIWMTGVSGDPRPIFQDAVIRARVPVFSPDGQRLAVQVQPDDSTLGIWMINADGSDAKPFSVSNANVNGASWNADGSAVYLNAFGNNHQSVIRVGLKDGSRQTVFEPPPSAARIHVTPDEQYLVYDLGRPRNIWRVRLKDKQAQQLTFDRQRAWFPVVSKDGKWVVYELTRGEDTQIAIMDIDGGQQQQLTDDPGKHFSSSMASDGRRIAYAGFEKGVWNLYWIDRITKERKQVTHHTAFGSFVRSPDCRPDSEQMAYEYSEVKGNIELLSLK